MASATFTPSNSTIADWLHFDWKTVPALTNCQLDNMNVSCTGVCNNSTALFAGPTNNLVNCGIWTSLVMGYTESEFNQTLGPTENASIYDSLFSPFQSLDLNASNFQNTSLYADTISHCFEFLYINVKRFSFADDGKTPAACTRPDLFPVTYGNTSLKDCVGEICSPLTLNPDLAGIGVFSSFIAQSCIALLALGALLALDLWSPPGARKPEKRPANTHTNKLIIALVEFHKAQCYFSSVIQITALSLFHTSNKAARTSTENLVTAHSFEDFFDTSVLIVLASSGLIPISLVLACIARYARQSWYLLLLSWISIILATTTMVSSYYGTQKYGKGQDWYNNNLNYPFDQDNTYGGGTSCALDGDLGDTVIPLCGNSKLLDNALPAGLIANWWTWLVWANCIVWMLFCLGKKCYDTDRFVVFRERIRKFAHKRPWVSFITKEGRAHRTWILISIIPWSLCFASQLYLFSAYFDHRVISYSWSFGQIIAVFVWVPSLVEFIYIELNGIQKASAYRYPPPLMVLRHVVHSSLSLANLASPEVRNDDENVGSPDNSRDDGSATGPRGHYTLVDGPNYS